MQAARRHPTATPPMPQEGNPFADLPNYRAHVLTMLGPSLALLDGRPVTAEERAAAGGAVAHEAMMLALMAANACLVHKLGRCVQLTKLHCELQCAVLGGQYGGSGGGEGVASGGRGMGRVLQMWDYEGSLGRQVGGWCEGWAGVKDDRGPAARTCKWPPCCCIVPW